MVKRQERSPYGSGRKRGRVTIVTYAQSVLHTKGLLFFTSQGHIKLHQSLIPPKIRALLSFHYPLAFMLHLRWESHEIRVKPRASESTRCQVKLSSWGSTPSDLRLQQKPQPPLWWFLAHAQEDHVSLALQGAAAEIQWLFRAHCKDDKARWFGGCYKGQQMDTVVQVCTKKAVTWVPREKPNSTTVHVGIYPSKVVITRQKLDKEWKNIPEHKVKSWQVGKEKNKYKEDLIEQIQD